MPGLAGLSVSFDYVMKNLPSIRERAKEMTARLMDGLESIRGIHIHGPGKNERRVPVVSVSADKDVAWLSATLLERGGIETRVGLHCSPSSHRTLGTFPTGTLRFSPGPFTTAGEIDTTIDILREAMNE